MKIIVTFLCSDAVHVYGDKCGLSPMSPFKPHSSIQAAKDHLKTRGVKKIKIINN